MSGGEAVEKLLVCNNYKIHEKECVCARVGCSWRVECGKRKKSGGERVGARPWGLVWMEAQLSLKKVPKL